MADKKRTTLQDIIQRRQQKEFVGRDEHLARFRDNLGYASDDERRMFIFNVSGQGGVGKTTLLRQFRHLAEAAGAAPAGADDSEQDAPSAMAHLAAQLSARGHSFKRFDERYKTYRQKREELEADPQAPQGFAATATRTVIKLGTGVVKEFVPGSSIALDYVDTDAMGERAGERVGEWAEFVRKKLGNKADVQLVLHPVDVLTPLFLADIAAAAETCTVVLFFDTFERTGGYLDPWLRDMLAGQHGDLPPDIVLVIAGRQALDRDLWTSFESLIIRFPLDPFTETEAREYLTLKGVTNDEVVKVILELTGRLPLLVATLALESPNDPTAVSSAAGTAIERFLKWVDNPARRQLAVDAALPRHLNRDLLSLLIGEDSPLLFDWLKSMPFVEDRGAAGWRYHEVVRSQMLQHKRREAPDGWAAQHNRLADYFEARRDALGLDFQQGVKDDEWQRYQLTASYHRLCAAGRRNLPATLNDFLISLSKQRAFARRLADAIAEAGRDSGVALVRTWGERLAAGLQAYEDDQFSVTEALFTSLLAEAGISETNRAVTHAWRGQTYRLLGRYDEALADLARALELDDKYAWAFASRGETYQQMGRYDEALADFTRALELDDKDAWAFAERGETYWLLERYDEALADLTHAAELNDLGASALLVIHGVSHTELGRYDEALADLTRALELNDKDAWAIASRGETYRQLGRYDEALADFTRALELDDKDAWAFASRGETYRQMGRYDETLADLTRALELDDKLDWAFASRGETYRQLGRYDEALADLSRALELDDKLDWAFASRGETYRQMGRYDGALADLTRALKLDDKDAWAFASRGETYRQLGRYDGALADLTRALELDDKYAWAFAQRGQTYQQMGRYDEALADLTRALELDESDWKHYQKWLTLKVAGPGEPADDSLAAAVRLAAEARQREPGVWRYTTNLALYKLVGGQVEAATALYEQALADAEALNQLREVLHEDLEPYLALFPHDVTVIAIYTRIKQHLATQTEA